MASVTRNDEQGVTADPPREDNGELAPPSATALPAQRGGGDGGQPPRSGGRADAGGGGFFTVYKSGQGYWTRMLTFLGFLLLGALTAQFIYSVLKTPMGRDTALGIAAGLFAVWVLIEYWILNKAKNADFLIATDSEMKKVNWTSRKDLIGSTKVVIFFMFLFAATLFIIDLVFHTLFWLATVLKTPPPFAS